jgi:hypothetical protein
LDGGSSRREREALKTKVLLDQFQVELRALSSVFHGIFFRLSQVTANLNRRKMGAVAFSLPENRGFLRNLSSFPARIVVALRLTAKREA